MKTISTWILKRKALIIYFPAAIILAAFIALPVNSAPPREFSMGTENTNDFRPAQILSSPRPEIPSELHEDCFKSCCLAKFIINPDGKTSVKLLSSTGNEELDEIALKTLKTWKFRPATLNGEPVSSTRRIRVEFEVE